MNTYDETLRTLAEKIAAKGSITLKRNAAQKQCDVLRAEAKQLQQRFFAEQADVDALEGHGFSALFYAAIGKKGEKLEKERAEAFAAKAKYDAAAYSLSALEGDLAHYEQQLRQMAGYEAEYEATLAQKAQQLKASAGADAETLLSLEAELIAARQQEKEIAEAQSAANKAASIVSDILTHLGKAEDWGTFDLIGGGMISDMAKHDHLNTAQNMMQSLQTQLRRLTTELADVNIQDNIQLNVEGFLHVADYFFDGLFVDWMVLDKIKNSQSQILQIQSQLHTLSHSLQGLANANRIAISNAEAKKKECIICAQL